MHEDNIEIYCSYCNAKHYLPFDESFENKSIKCDTCKNTFYWHHCPVCEIGFVIDEDGNTKCIECNSGIYLNDYFDSGATGMENTNVQIPYRVLKRTEESDLNRKPSLLHFLFCLQCTVCGCWHFPLNGMGKIPIICKCGTIYSVKSALFLITFFNILLIGAFVQVFFFPPEYQNKLINIILLIIFILIALAVAPRITKLKVVSKSKE
jgi:hypothetical protein